MAEAGRLVEAASAPPIARMVLAVRVAIVLAVLTAWELVAASGLLFRDVVPSLVTIGRAVGTLLADPTYYRHLGVTLAEVAGAITIGGLAGIVVGIALGANRFLARAYRIVPRTTLDPPRRSSSSRS